MKVLFALWLGFFSICGFSQPTPNEFFSQHCGLKFNVPAGWTVQRTETTPDPKRRCTFRVQPTDLSKRIARDDDVDLYTIEVSTMPVTLDAAATEASFERKGGEWIVKGRTDIESPAEKIALPHLHGLKATSTVGCNREGGGYVGLCDIPVAVVSAEGKLSATLTGNPQSTSEFEMILNSLKLFHRTAAAH